MCIALTLEPGVAHADLGDDFTVVALFVVLVFGADVAFTVYDISVVNTPEGPSRGWGIAQAAVATPQAALANGFIYSGAKDSSDPLGYYLLSLTYGGWTSQLSTYGVWAAVHPETDPLKMLGASWAMGLNMPMTFWAFGAASEGEFIGTGPGVAAMAVTAPQIIANSIELGGTNDAVEAGGRIAITTWAGLLFAHGLTSVIVDASESEPAESAHSGKLDAPRDLIVAPFVEVEAPDGRPSNAPGLAVGGTF